MSEKERENPPENGLERERGDNGPGKGAGDVKERLGRMFGWVNGPGRAVSFAVLVVVLVFFGRDLLSSLRVRADIRALRERKSELERTVAADSTLLRRLDDPEFLEKFARENYLLRREGEEVYVIIDK